MQQINTTLKLIQPKLEQQTTQAGKPESLAANEPVCKCSVCEDSGFEIIDGVARKCQCRLKLIRERKLASIPAMFRDMNLQDLTASVNRHPKQSKYLPIVQGNPNKSFFLAGQFGSGKSLMLWMLYKHAVIEGRSKTVVCTLSELLNEYKAFIQASMNRETPKYPRLNAEELRQNDTKYSIFLDDIDKAKPTEYAAENFFEIVNAAYEYKHQVVVTTNLTVMKLIDHFDRADDRFGGAIVRRLVADAEVIEMF